jgi:hypothetical protein
MLIYLAYPIDRADHADISGLAEMPTKYTFYLPGRAFVTGTIMSSRDCAKLAQANLAVLHQCDALVVRYYETVPTWGVPIEVTTAAREGIPVYVYTPEALPKHKLPVYLRAWVPDGHIGSLHEVVQMLQVYEDGLIKVQR